jgi:hypothetical protein
VAMLAGFMNTPEPMILPTIMEVADQKPIFWAREEVDDISKEGKEKQRFGLTLPTGRQAQRHEESQRIS